MSNLLIELSSTLSNIFSFIKSEHREISFHLTISPGRFLTFNHMLLLTLSKKGFFIQAHAYAINKRDTRIQYLIVVLRHHDSQVFIVVERSDRVSVLISRDISYIIQDIIILDAFRGNSLMRKEAFINMLML